MRALRPFHSLPALGPLRSRHSSSSYLIPKLIASRRLSPIQQSNQLATASLSSECSFLKSFFYHTRTMSTAADHTPLKNPPKKATIPRPSSSVLLISPQNQILLLHRVRTSSSFASAHVFPGGALSTEHDGEIPAPDSPLRHQDGPVYRMAAVRETFEECGVLLAKNKKTGRLFTEISDEEREEGRRAVHQGRVKFPELLERWGAEADLESLIPFTRWVTPPGVPKRFTTQMYLYFLPLSGTSSPTTTSANTPPSSGLSDDSEIVIPTPTHDGGIEHTAARFLPPHKWISLARANRIILFPPQFFLMSLLEPYLSPTVTSASSPIPSIPELAKEREECLAFLNKKRVYDGEEEVSFAEACISPMPMGKGGYGELNQDGIGGLSKDIAVLKLDFPGKEVESQGLGRRGLREWIVTTRFKRDGPRDVDVVRRGDLLGKPKIKL